MLVVVATVGGGVVDVGAAVVRSAAEVDEFADAVFVDVVVTVAEVGSVADLVVVFEFVVELVDGATVFVDSFVVLASDSA